MPGKVTIELDKSVADALGIALDAGTASPPPPPPPSGGVTITLEANADPYSSTDSPGPWPIVQLLVAGKQVGQPVEINTNAQTGAWKAVTWKLDAAPADADAIAVRFTNDAADPTDWMTPGNDRNLHIKRLVLAVPGKPPVELTPATAVYRGDDGTVGSPADEIMYREGLMVWRDAAPSPPPPPGPLPPPPPGPITPGVYADTEILLVTRKRLSHLDPRSVPFDQRPVFTRDIFVDINRGSPGNSGDERSPLKTLDDGQRRARELGPGTRVQVRAGVYDFGAGSFVWSADGRPDAWFGLVGYPGERPIVRNHGWDCVHLKGHYCLLEGFHAAGSRFGYTSPWSGRRIDSDDQYNEECRARIGNKTHEPSGWDSGGGIYVAGGQKGQNGRGVHHVIVRDCIADNWPGSGLGSAGMDYVLVEDFLAHFNCQWMGWGASGVSIFSPRDLGSFGSEAHRLVIRRSICSNNIQYKPTFGRDSVSDGGGFQADVYASEFDYRQRTLFYSNLAYGNGQSGLHSTSSGYVDYVNNTCYGNNQLPQNHGSPEMWVGWDSSDCQYLGNVLVSTHGVVPLAMVQTASDRPRTSRNNVLSKATNFMGPGDIVADPLFINATLDPRTANFRLRANSPALGKGEPLAGSDLFGAVGAAPCAGAIWLRSSEPPPSPPPPAPPPPPPPVTLPGATIEVAGNRLVYKGQDLRLIGPCMDALARIGDRSAADQTRAALRYVDVIRDEWDGNVLRVHLYPTKWRAMVARGEGRAYLDALRNRARERGMWWMVDNHVVGAPDGAVSEWQDPQDGRVDWALELATQIGQWYGDDPSLAVFVGWDEPCLFASGQFAWREMAPVHQRILDAYRAAGGKAIYGANGTHWARVYRGWRDHRLVDPLDRVCVSFHDFEAAGRPGGEWQNFDQFMDGIHDAYPLFLIGLTIEPVDAPAPDPDYAAWLTGKLRDLRPSVNPWGDAWADPKIYLDGWPNDAPMTWRPMGRWIRNAVAPAEILRP